MSSPVPSHHRRVLTLAEVSDLTRIPVESLRHLRKAGRGPRLFRLAKRLVAFEDEVIAWIEAQAAADRSASEGAA